MSTETEPALGYLEQWVNNEATFKPDGTLSNRDESFKKASQSLLKAICNKKQASSGCEDLQNQRLKFKKTTRTITLTF